MIISDFLFDFYRKVNYFRGVVWFFDVFIFDPYSLRERQASRMCEIWAVFVGSDYSNCDFS